MTQAGAGVHCILELRGCPFELLDDEKFIRDTLSKAAEKAHSELLTLTSHKFDPQGVTALGLLAESHISIHTWPEAGYAAVDCFTCGPNCSPQRACDHLASELRADDHTCLVIPRGKGVDSSCAGNDSLEEAADRSESGAALSAAHKVGDDRRMRLGLAQ